MNGGELAGRAAIVPGGAGGIGSAVCRELAGRGAAVVVADLDLEQARAVAAALPGAGHDAVAVDVADGAAVRAAVQGAAAARERIDLLVYCAGNNIKAPSLELSAAQWRSALDSHLTGAFLFSQAVGRHLVARGSGGRMVYVSSVGAWAPIPERGAYSPSKAALNSLAGMLAVEWARYGINVNTVCPGVAATAMTTLVYSRDPALRSSRRKRMPIPREVYPEEIAALVAFLCGPGGDYINGAAIPIDGGFLQSGFMPEPNLEADPGQRPPDRD
ncbi:MAG: SDR family NAD(P)-dependent oxidoreductase [Spirochaetaceae bacterium]|nr:SDR family NAD(P)-dependent oxidoreductase [Spirochaetaceae bacterium]MDE0448034.1 SDR family NAD(P)-dependent oxidoreductase [Spirochaetaceae bacterium]